MYLVDWNSVASGDLLNELRALAQVEGPSDAELRPVVAALLSHVGGLPVTPADWPEPHRRAVGRRLIHEAVGRALRVRWNLRRPLPGVHTAAEAADPLREASVSATPRVDVNRATAKELEALPVLGATLAQRVVDERRHAGPFRSAFDLAARVHGVGDAGAATLRPRIHADPDTGGSKVDAFSGEFERDFRRLLALASGSSGADQLIGALEALTQMAAAEPHPATAARMPRLDLAPSAAVTLAWLPASQATVLEDEAYHPTVRDLLQGAQQKVELAMFFIATPGPEHPTRELLEALSGAKQRGASVRVLVDRDRESDPYGSRIINAEAADELSRRGVEVRHDRADVLLHSKFLVVDDRATVIGSHNWTAGSYFRYHDLSILLEGPSTASAMRARFDTLWEDGTSHPP